MSNLNSENIRVRIAPSPTGPFHIGTARTALFNFLFAKKHKGVFVLRIEDTDPKRSKKQYEQDIAQGLEWLGIKWDEGIILSSEINSSFEHNFGKKVIGVRKYREYIGNYGPYRQSERFDIYTKYLKKLLKEGNAYHCFCSKQELQEMKEDQIKKGEPPRYTGKCRSLSAETVNKYLSQGKSCITRLKVPYQKVIFHDLIRGRVEFDSKLLGDFAIAKYQQKNNQELIQPLYNFAVVVDDFEMKITHVIRGEDHISNTPKQILIRNALRLSQPQYAHLPLILGPDRSKLSKRHGATSIAEYKKLGYLPEALINFMALLGWHPSQTREIFSMDNLIKEFSLRRVQKGGAVFNIQKLDWLNGVYIRKKPLRELTKMCIPYLVKDGLITPVFENKERVPNLCGYFGQEIVENYVTDKTKEKIDFEYLKKIVAIYQGRLKKLSEIPGLTDFFFKTRLEYKKELLRWKKMTDKELRQILDKLKGILFNVKKEDWEEKELEKLLLPAAKDIGKGDRGRVLWPFRVALCGKKASAGPFEIAAILGKEKTVKRLEQAIEKLGS